MKDRLGLILDFLCSRCTNKVGGGDKVGNSDEVELILDGQPVEKVGAFCYLGDTLAADGSADLAVNARVNSGWNKFREVSSILTGKFISWKRKGKIYDSCVRSCMTYACETWPMTESNMRKLVTTENRMIRYMCGVSWRDKKSSSDLLKEVGLEGIEVIVRRSRLRWYGHVRRKEDDDWVKRCMDMKVEGVRSRGRPMKTWRENVIKDMRETGLKEGDVSDRLKWRRGTLGLGLR